MELHRHVVQTQWFRFSADSCQPLVNLNHFRLLRVVGKGAFGKVRIVERKDNGDQFALKYIRKDEGMPYHSNTSWLVHHSNKVGFSGAVRERTEHHPRTKNAGTFATSFSVQPAIQFSGYRILVRRSPPQGLARG
jgi:serine/threonine protein kinase